MRGDQPGWQFELGGVARAGWIDCVPLLIGAGSTSEPDGAVAASAFNLLPLPAVVIGGQLARVLYAGPSPGLTSALTQINVQIPFGPSGQLPIWVLYNSSSSQFGATLFVQ